MSAGPAANPVLPGSHPDPSICRIGEDYYLVTSTFEYFPGLPVYHSRDALRLTGPEHVLFRGALAGAAWVEGPRLVRHDGHCYLVVAEGGTEHHHAVTVARSEQVTGPYQGNPDNPVLTHRHLGRGYPVVGAGHADLVRDPAGNWHAVLLATRQYAGGLTNLGRETFLASVIWEDGWPVVNPGAGRLLASSRRRWRRTCGRPSRRPMTSTPPRWPRPGACSGRHARTSAASPNGPATSGCDCGPRP